MSGAMINLYSEHDAMRFNVEDGGRGEMPAIWIRSTGATVSLTFSADDRAQMRAALDQADAIGGAA